eukprot:447247_1
MQLKPNMDALNSVFQIYTNNTTIINAISTMILSYFGLSITDAVKWIQKHATRRIIAMCAHLLLSALLYHIHNKYESPLEDILNANAKKIIPVGMNFLPGKLLDFALKNFVFRMIVRLSYVVVELYTFVSGLVYYIGETYIPLYFGQIVAWILSIIPQTNPKNNNWPIYASAVAISHIVVGIYIFMYKNELDGKYYSYNDRDIIAFLLGGVYWTQLAFWGNDMDANNDGNFTIKEISQFWKNKLFVKVSAKPQQKKKQ